VQNDTDFMDELEDVPKQLWKIYGDAKVNNGNHSCTISRQTDHSNAWNDLWVYDSPLTSGKWQFEVQIRQIYSEKNGLFIGFIEDKD